MNPTHWPTYEQPFPPFRLSDITQQPTVEPSATTNINNSAQSDNQPPVTAAANVENGDNQPTAAVAAKKSDNKPSVASTTPSVAATAEKIDKKPAATAVSEEECKKLDSTKALIEKYGNVIWVNITLEEALKKACSDDLKRLALLRECMEKVKLAERAAAYMMEDREHYSQQIQDIIKFALAKKPCSIPTLQDAYQILEIADQLQLFSETDSVATFENIFETTKSLLQYHPETYALILFTLMICEEASNWGPISEKFAESKKVLLPLLHKLMLNQLPKLLTHKVDVGAKYVDVAAQYLCIIPIDAIQDEESSKTYKEACFQFLECANNCNPDLQKKALYIIAGRNIELIKDHRNRHIDDTINSLALLNAVFMYSFMKFREHQFSFKEKFLEGCNLFLKNAQELNDRDIVQIAVELLINQILPIISPKDVDTIATILSFEKSVRLLLSNQAAKSLDPQLLRLFTEFLKECDTNISLLCHSGTNKDILKAIQIFSKHNQQVSLYFKYILEACKDDLKLLETFKEIVVNKMNKNDSQLLSDFGKHLLAISTQHYDSRLGVICLGWLEELSAPLRASYPVKSTSALINFHKQKEEENIQKISLLTIYIQFCLLFGNEKQMAEAWNLMLPDGDSQKIAINFTSPVPGIFLELSFEGNPVLLNRLKNRLQPYLENHLIKKIQTEDEQKQGQDTLRLANQLVPSMNQGIFQRLSVHIGQMLKSKEKTSDELIKLFQQSINFLPLYAAFKETEGRWIITKLMQHFAENPEELFTTMVKAVEMADQCRLYGPIGDLELSTEVDPKLLAKRIRLEEELIEHLTDKHDPKIISGFLTRFKELHILFCSNHYNFLESSVKQSLIGIFLKLLQVTHDLNLQEHDLAMGWVITDPAFNDLVCKAAKKMSTLQPLSRAIQAASFSHLRTLSKCYGTDANVVENLIDTTLELLPWYGVGHDSINQQAVITNSIMLLFQSPKKDLAKMKKLMAAIDTSIPKFDFDIEKNAAMRFQEVFANLESREFIGNIPVLLELASPIKKDLMMAMTNAMVINQPEVITSSMLTTQDRTFYRSYIDALKILIERMDEPNLLSSIQYCLENCCLFPIMIKHCIESQKLTGDKKGEEHVEASIREQQLEELRSEIYLQANQLFNSLTLPKNLDKKQYRHHFDLAVKCVVAWTSNMHFEAFERDDFTKWCHKHFMELFDLFFNPKVISTLQKKIKEDPNSSWLNQLQQVVKCIKKVTELLPNATALNHRLANFLSQLSKPDEKKGDRA